jgi:hypothetical protein
MHGCSHIYVEEIAPMPFSSALRPSLLLAGLAAIITFAACSDNPAAPPPGAGDPENISLVTITLTPTTSGHAVATAFIRDSDGTTLPKSPNPPSGPLVLDKGITYNGTIDLKNDIGNPVVNISDEVFNERDFHRFFYTITNDTTAGSPPRDSINIPPTDAAAKVDIPISSLNLDSLGNVFGSTFQVIVDPAAPGGSSILNAQLHHFEQEKGTGLGTTFDTDLQVNFLVTVQ